MRLTVTTSKFHFELNFERNISIVRGASGTGKSFLCQLLLQSRDDAEAGDIQIEGNKYFVMPATTIGQEPMPNWKQLIAGLNNTLVFIDEICDCLADPDFASTIKGTDNFYVIITRDVRGDLPYSIDSVYSFTVGELQQRKYCLANTSVITMQQLDTPPEHLVTEDENAGAVYYSKLFSLPAEPAKSKTKVYRKAKGLLSQNAHNILFVVDNAAFGAEWEKLSTLLIGTDCRIYAPESFEWVLLHSPIFANYHHLLVGYLDDIDWTKYFSGEKYFTAKCEEAYKSLGWNDYDKSASAMKDQLLTPESVDRVRDALGLTANILKPYTLEDFEHDTEALMFVMEKGYDWEGWFTKKFPNGAPSRGVVINAIMLDNV